MLFFLVFVEHIATVLLERGIHFYTEARLGFTPTQNLIVGLAAGVAYVVAALASHAVAHRFTEKRTLIACLAGLIGFNLGLCFNQTTAFVVAAVACLGVGSGMHWAVIESYIGSGRTPREQLRSVGWFNITWSSTIPIGLGLVGLILATGSAWLLFGAAVACHLLSLGVVVACLPRRPPTIDHDHPERPDPARLRAYRKLLVASRWSMMGGYTMLFLLAPLLPFIFGDLGLDAQRGAWASSVMDVARVACFYVMGFVWGGWHGRAWPLIVTIVALPVGFAMILFGDTLSIVLVGEVLFGIAGGVCYYAALYYAMVVKNGAVDAGGVHEGIIGMGFVVGPLVGLLGQWIEPMTGGEVSAMSLAVAPLILITTLGAAWPLLALGKPATTDEPTRES